MQEPAEYYFMAWRNHIKHLKWIWFVKYVSGKINQVFSSLFYTGVSIHNLQYILSVQDNGDSTL